MPITLASGHADKGCLQSPELAPSECCPQPPPKSRSWPSGAPGPQQPSRSMGRMPVDTKPMACLPPPWSDAAGPQTWPRGQQGPIHRHQVSFPWQARERQAGYYHPQHQDHACPRGPGCPVMPGQRVASLWGRGDGRGEGGWLGHRCCHRSDRPAGFQPPRTLFIRLSMLSGGGQESAPVLGPHGRQCPAPLAVPAAGGSWGAEELHLTASSG